MQRLLKPSTPKTTTRRTQSPALVDLCIDGEAARMPDKQGSAKAPKES